MRTPLLGLGLVLLAACSSSTRDVEGEPAESALTASWFAAHLPAGSAEAKAVLALANDRTFDAADYVSKVGIKSNAAGALVNYRLGDSPNDPSDDETFDDLKELDAVPFTDEAFFVAMKAYAVGRYDGAVCATGSSKYATVPLYLQFVLDGSGSMGADNKWPAVVSALDALFDDAAAHPDKTLGMGLTVFSDDRDPTSSHGPYPSTRDVGIGFVSAAQRDALRARIDASHPGGATPTLKALTGAYDAIQAFTPQSPLAAGGTRALVFLSDGVPDGGTAEQNASIALVTQRAASAQLFAVGVGPIPGNNQYDPRFLGALAVAGHTRSSVTCDPNESTSSSNMCHLQITPGARSAAQISQDFTAAFAKIRTQVAACDIGLTTLGERAPDPANVNVIYRTASGVEEPLSRDATNGWSFDDDAHPTKIRLNGESCATLRSETGASVRASLGCVAPEPPKPAAAANVVAGEAHMCMLTDDGAVKCWGNNTAGELGVATTTKCENFACSTSPVAVPLPAAARHVAAGYQSTCATLVDGTVYCWGADQYRQLGFSAASTCPEGACELAPRKVPGLTGVAAVALGETFMCARLVSGEVRCVGDNSVGQLGDGTTQAGAMPTSTGITGAIDLVAGGNHACVILGDASVKCWGFDTYGQVGASTGTCNRSPCVKSPATMAGLAGVAQLTAGATHTCARMKDGSVSCWGNNQAHQSTGSTATCLGVGCSSTPIVAAGLTNVVQIASGREHTCVRSSDGTVKCWGFDFGGQLGYTPSGYCGAGGFPTCSGTPTAVPTVTAATGLVLGNSHSCAMRADGSALCWGTNVRGEFGDGSTMSSQSPVPTSW